MIFLTTQTMVTAAPCLDHLFQIRPRLTRYLVDELIDDIPEPLVGEFEGSRTISIWAGDHRKVRLDQ